RLRVKESLREKLVGLVERHEEIARLLMEPQVIADKDRFRDLSREYARLGQVAADCGAFQRVERDIAASEELKAGREPALRELAERRASLEKALLSHLVPRDPDDDANLFLEIRAGTGGDEAAIFAGDLFRMYSRYAEEQGWSIEILSENPGEHGGYKEIISRV